MKKQTIYLLFWCDVWKSSMSLCGAGTSPSHVRRLIERELHAKAMTYGNITRTVTEQIRELRADWKEQDLSQINDKLAYGFCDTTACGETYH